MSENAKIMLISAVTSTAAIVVAIGIFFVWQNWYRLGRGYAWDTLLIRCEQERKGVLIGDTCVKKDAIIWPAIDAPR
jgi:hypothetical protein